MERITLPSYVHLYGGFAGNETLRSQRDWTRHETILDGGISVLDIVAVVTRFGATL